MSEPDPLLEAVANKRLTVVDFGADVLADFPKLKDAVFVRVLNAGERHLYGSTALHAKAEGGYISDYEIVAICACNADGTPRFHSFDAEGRIKFSNEHLNKLRRLDGRVIYAIAQKALEVSGLTDNAAEDAKKNSEEVSSSDSS